MGNILTQYILDMDKDIICGYTQHHPFEKYIFIDINYKNKAIEILEKFPNNESRDSIKTLLDYIIERKY